MWWNERRRWETADVLSSRDNGRDDIDDRDTRLGPELPPEGNDLHQVLSAVDSYLSVMYDCYFTNLSNKIHGFVALKKKNCPVFVSFHTLSKGVHT